MYGLSNVYYVYEDANSKLIINTYLVSVIAEFHWS